MKMIKISIELIHRIGVGNLAAAAAFMSAGIYGHLTIFKGTIPYTAAQIAALIKTYTDAKTAFELGGIGQKKDYEDARDALFACLVTFAPYIDGIALGDKTILALTGLPTTEDVRDIPAEIRAGAKATGVKITHGRSTELKTDCEAFGNGVDYLVIVSEGSELPVGITLSGLGQLMVPSQDLVVVFMGVTGKRVKSFVGLKPGTKYWFYYVLIHGETVGLIGDPVALTCD